MSKVLEYNGFIGSVDFSLEDQILFGSLLHINDLVTYEGETIQELEKAFQEAVEEYIELCKECDKEPEKPFKGVFNVRVSPETHKKAVFEAEKRGMTLNQFVGEAIQKSIENYDINTKEHKEISDKIEDVGNRFDEAFTQMNRNFAANSALNLMIRKGELANG